MRRAPIIAALAALCVLLFAAAPARADSTNVFRTSDAWQQLVESAIMGESASVSIVSGAGFANYWIDTNGGTCTRQASPGAYVDAQACSTFNAPWLTSSNGDVARVRPGAYGTQSFAQRGSPMTCPGFTVIMEGGASLTTDLKFGDNTNGFGSSNQFVDCITVKSYDPTDRFTIGDELSFGHADDILISDFTMDKNFAQSKAVFWRGDTNRTKIDNADLCCVDNYQIMEGFTGNDETSPNSNITIEDTNLHTMRRSGGSAVHNECFLTGPAPGLTLNRTHWAGCTSGVNFNMGAFGDFAPTVDNYNWTITNSIFEAPTENTETDKLLGFAIFAGCNFPHPGLKTGWVVMNNIFEGPFYPDSGFGCGDSGMIFRNNIMRTGGNQCPGGMVTYSVFDRTCTGTGNVNAGASATLFSTANFPGYTSAGVDQDWTYGASAVQINKGDPLNYPSIDKNGVTRPLGGFPDAGPYEAG